jgi:anti-sigma B factor antagonist
MKGQTQFEARILDNGVLCVKLAGRLDVDHTHHIEDDFSVEVGSRKAAVVVDLSGVDFIGSVALELLLKHAKIQYAYGGRLVVCCPKPIVRQVLDVSGIEQSIPVYDNFDAALRDVLAEPPGSQRAGFD